jgi:hypothetical protein
VSWVTKHHRIIILFLDHGISITTNGAHPDYNGSRENLISYATQYPDTLECCESMKAIILKSEDALRNIIARNEVVISARTETYSLYQTATLFGWTRGCEILLENGAQLGIGCRRFTPMSLLDCAMRSYNINVLRLWINISPELDGDDLYHVGYPEEALSRLPCLMYTYDSVIYIMLEEIVSELAQRRRCLQTIADATSIELNSPQKTTTLLNSHAREVYDDLVDHDVHVQPYLQPKAGNLFGRNYGPWQIPVMNMLYTAGFRDINDDLIFQCMTLNGPTYSADWWLDIYEWFMGKGMYPKAQWPNSRITILHCLAWKRGKAFQFNNKRLFITKPWLISTLMDTCCDSCKCGCSTNGCLPITMLYKGIENGTWTENKDCLFERMISIHRHGFKYIDSSSPEDKWFVAALIRIMTFRKLGIRHTCCDLSRLEHRGLEHRGLEHRGLEHRGLEHRDWAYDRSFDLHDSPIRYPPEDIRRIRKEEAFLLGLLDELVEEFEHEFDMFEKDLESFFTEIWETKMEKVLMKLGQEDFEQYGAGRREMGVVMEMAGRNEADDESEDDDDQSSDYEGDTSGEEEHV